MSDDDSAGRDGLEYSSDADIHRVEFSRESERASTAVVKAVAAIAGVKQDDLDPLYYVVDPDALDSLFQPTVKGGHRGDAEISFSYHGYDVTVRSYGIIEITPGNADSLSERERGQS